MLSKRGLGSLDIALIFYVLAYVPNVVLTRLVTRQLDAEQVATQGGAEILPVSMLFNLVLTLSFIGLAGWYREAHGVQLGRLRLPRPTWRTFVSGFGSALVLCTVPLSFTFTSVSIPFIQMLMKGSILLLAPLVDLAYRRRVRWWSWTALVLVAASLLVVILDRGGLHVPPMALITVGLYTGGYFLRILVMTQVAKREDATTGHGYFVEEKLVALPLSIVIIAILAAAGQGADSISASLHVLAHPTAPTFWTMLGVGITLTVVAVCATLILISPQENSYCVPLERSISLLGGLVAAWLLAWGWDMAAPTGTEIVGALMLASAIVLLTVAPRAELALAARQQPSPVRLS